MNDKTIWIVTERFNIFLSGGILLFGAFSLNYFFPKYFGGIFLDMILIGLWIMAFYKWELVLAKKTLSGYVR